MPQTKPPKEKMSHQLKKPELKRKESSPKEKKVVHTSLGDHNYQGCAEEEEVNLVSLPDTPLKSPAPKKLNSGQTEPSMYELQMTILKTVNDRADELARLISSNAADIKELKVSVEFAHEEINDIKSENAALKKQCEKNQMEISSLKERVTDAERYKRRWCLRLYGLPEQDNENVKQRVAEICQKITPEMGARAAEGIDIAHRLGRRAEGKTRGVIILFTFRSVRDEIWRAAKNNNYLREKKLRLGEDLTKEDKEKRAALWPIIERARKNGSKAYFVGVKGYIDGKEIRHVSES